MKLKKLSPGEKWILLGIPVIFIIGSLFHFIYDWSGKNIIVGLISPIDESIFQHIKLVVIPIICWWTFYYYLKGKNDNISPEKWFAGALISLLSSIILIPSFYYLYTGALGIESLIVDVLILLVALFFAQLLGLHFFRHSKGFDTTVVLCSFVFIILLFAILTLHSPNLPIFIDASKAKLNP